MKVIKRPCLCLSTGARPQQLKSRAFHPITSHNEDLYTDLHLLSAIASFGAAAPTLEKRVQYCYNYPHRIAGSYFTKRDIEPIEPVTPAISVRSPDTDLHTRSVPLHIQWCLPGSNIYVNPVYVGQQALGIAASVVEAMVLEALEHVDQYLHTHGEGQLLPLNSWNWLSGQDDRWTFHVHGHTTFLVLQHGLESMLNYMQIHRYYATGTWNFCDHILRSYG